MVVRALTALLPLTLLAAALHLLPDRASGGAETATSFKRLSRVSPDELQRQLDAVPVVGMGTAAPAVLNAYATRVKNDFDQSQMAVDVLDATPLLEVRPDLRTLPLRRGEECKLSNHSATALEALSRKLRVYLEDAAPINERGERPALPRLRTVLQSDLRGSKPEWLRAEAVPTLLQLLMHESTPVRLMLVELLQAVPEKVSTVALARRAAFDLDPEVREAAVAALRERPAAESRPVLVELLRYPWAPVADHAAEALANLHDSGAVPQLIAALDQPDPALSQPDAQGKLFVREVVRVHHLTNCLLCHPLASTGAEAVLGADPLLVLNLAGLRSGPGLAQASQRLQGTRGGHTYGRSSSGGGRPPTSPGASPALLRGDITYLRQDFSALQTLPPVLASLQTAGGPLSAPTQRFDFVVRKRPVSRSEASLLKTVAGDRPDYPQHAAVRFALRELTGQDLGGTTADWMKAYPDAGVEAEAARLAAALTSAKPERREQLLARYRDEKGVAHTLALAAAIPGIQGKLQQNAREALAARLSRMTAASLRERFREEDPELRSAAAVASGRKGDAGLVPDLVRLLDDDEGAVKTAAASALRELTGKSFTTAKEWQAWWSDHKVEGRTR
jgi:HEAT repeat protein